MNITPLTGHYVIDIPQTAETTAGLILADVQTNSSPVVGTITAAYKDSPLAVGTQVIFRKYAIDELKLSTPEGEKIMWMLDERDILGVVVTS